MFIRHQWVSVGAIFSVWRNSVTHLCFILTSMSDTIVSECPSAAICHEQQNVMEYCWKGSPSTAIPPTSISDIEGPHNGGLIFRAAHIDLDLHSLLNVYVWNVNHVLCQNIFQFLSKNFWCFLMLVAYFSSFFVFSFFGYNYGIVVRYKYGIFPVKFPLTLLKPQWWLVFCNF